MPSSTKPDYDVLIVGAGPVGLTMSILLGRRGYRTAVVERWPAPYPQPRAVHFDHEIARVFASGDLGGKLAAITDVADVYDWRNARGQTLLHFDWSGMGPSGWPRANGFHQPDLEDALQGQALAQPSVTLQRGAEAVDLVQHADCVQVTVQRGDGSRPTLTAAYVIGCDGAGSFVRSRMQTGLVDRGFFFDWLICDVIEKQPRVWDPKYLQVCDPARPTTVVGGGPGHRRWEFMRLPSETVDELNRDETAWRLLAPWGITPQTAVLDRHVVYTFQARWAERWRDGRLLICGDAAHLMPPFAGQGMCSGIRDAANLAWKLDLVLSGRVGDGLLDTYTSERSAHLQHAIDFSVELGKVICILDPAVAAERDARMLAVDGDPARALPPLPPEVLGPGLLRSTAGGAPAGPAGQLGIQGRVRTADGRAGLFDDVVGTGFVLMSATEPAALLRTRYDDLLSRLQIRLVHVVPPGTPLPAASGTVQTVVDLDNRYLPDLRAHGCVALLLRPDFYIYGGAAEPAGIPALLDDLDRRLAELAGDDARIPA